MCMLHTTVAMTTHMNAHITGNSEALKMTVALIGKFAVGGSFSVIYIYSAELFPTQVRNIGVGVASIGARLGGIFSPIVLLLVRL